MKRFLSTFVILLCAVLTSGARGQNQPNQEPTQEDMIRQMQDLRQQVMQNMMDKGIDPQEFVSQIRDQMMSGNFDPAQMQQMLVDRGLIDKKMLDNIQNTSQRFLVGNIRQQLGATDQEWEVLAPKIQKVVAAGLAAGQAPGAVGGPGGAGGGAALLMGSSATNSEVNKAMGELRAALRDKNSPSQLIVKKLQALRDAREKAKTDFDAAKKELQAVVTVRQEAILLQMGYL